ncbi:MAG: PilZ domain-containing protein [Acidobacteria bacterium]|nr:PilZ domain-containing protein [Acidobacteriota bacterium]
MDDARLERRAHERLRLPLEAQWEGQAGEHEAHVQDLSPGGCYIESDGQVSDGERVTIRVRTPSGAWLVIHGAVAHHQPLKGFGVLFLPLAPATRYQLEDIIRSARGGK